MTNDECGMTNGGRRGFLKLLGAVVAPKVAEAVPEVVLKPRSVGASMLAHVGVNWGGDWGVDTMQTATALKLWMGQQKAREMREHLLEGKPLPIRQVYGVELQDEPEEDETDE